MISIQEQQENSKAAKGYWEFAMQRYREEIRAMNSDNWRSAVDRIANAKEEARAIMPTERKNQPYDGEWTIKRMPYEAAELALGQARLRAALVLIEAGVVTGENPQDVALAKWRSARFTREESGPFPETPPKGFPRSIRFNAPFLTREGLEIHHPPI